MTEPVLFADTWEEGGQIDEAVLFANRVSGLFIRINEGTVPGTWLNRDDNFDVQWAQAVSLVRVVYFVVDPGRTAQEMFDWLVANMPPGQFLVALDVEVSRAGFTPAQYGKLLRDLLALIKTRWRYVIYTGEWFLGLLDAWPVDADYWWAEYPFALYPNSDQTITWDQLRARLGPFAGPLNADKVPGRLKAWQFTADRFFLPGCDHKLDVCQFFGSFQEFTDWAGDAGTTPSPPANTDEIHTEPFPGVKFDKVFRFGSWCHILTEPSDLHYRQHVTPFALRTVSADAKLNKAQTAINGGDYFSYGPVGLLVSGGVYYGAQRDYDPFFHVDQDGTPALRAWNSAERKWDAVMGLRFIVENGQQSTHTSAAWHEVHPRTLIGIRSDKKVVKCAVDGRQPGYSIGIDLFQAAQIMIEFGCVTAIDIGGGGDTTMVIDEKVVNRPSDGQERKVGDRILMTITDYVPPSNPPPEGGTMDQYQVLIAVRPRPGPSMSTPSSDPNIPAGTTFGSSTTQVDSVTAGNPTMVLIEDGPYLGKWVPLVYNNIEYVKKVSTTTPPVGAMFTLTVAGYKPYSGVLEPE